MVNPQNIFVLIAWLACSLAAKADHLPMAAHTFYLQKRGASFYENKPATSTRALRESTQSERYKEVAESANTFLHNGSKLALILLDQGQIVFEGYTNTATKDTKFTSWSMAKSLTALAVGEALCAGKIKSLDDSGQTYSPPLTDTAFGRASIKNLMTMASGSTDDGIEPFLSGVNLDTFRQVQSHKIPMIDYIKKYGALKISSGTPLKPGEDFAYNGLNTESLAFVVEGATGMLFTKWFEQNIWSKAGGGASSFWEIDKEGKAIAQSVFLASARDYARIALYTLDRLTGNSPDTCMGDFLREATQPQMATKIAIPSPSYGYQIWVRGNGNAYFTGHGGQVIGFNARTNRAFVLLSWGNSRNVFQYSDTWLKGAE